MNIYKFVMTFALIYVLFFCFILVFERYKLFKSLIRYMSIAYIGFNSNNLRGIFCGFVWAFMDGLITGCIIYFVIKLLS